MGDLLVSDRAACPSCGRYVGPYESCPYCGARLSGRISLRVVKMAALVLATLGLAVLWWAARSVAVPAVSIGEIQGLMNLAYVRVEGTVARSVTFDPETGYLAFWLDDGTGELRVSSYRDVTQVLLDQGRVPAVAPGRIHSARCARVMDGPEGGRAEARCLRRRYSYRRRCHPPGAIDRLAENARSIRGHGA